ncbi:MAG: hypothetical protein NZO16_00475 [Deltaproteobacteria bacterium]|nr:hypothetical protein [Deltaproteobacteria bacterium]
MASNELKDHLVSFDGIFLKSRILFERVRDSQRLANYLIDELKIDCPSLQEDGKYGQKTR